MNTLSEEIKDIFVKWKMRKIPSYGTRRFTDAEEAVFEKAAILCDQLKADPTNYVYSQVAEKNQHEFPVNFLCTRLSESLYNDYVSDFTTDIPLDRLWEFQVRYLTDQIKFKRKVEDILMDDKIPLYPWFRIVISVAPIPEVIEKYKRQARILMTPELTDFLRGKGFDVNHI